MIKTTKRETIKGILGTKKMTLKQISAYCVDYGLMSALDVARTVNNMFNDGMLISVGMVHQPNAPTKGSMVVVYKVNNEPVLKHQGLAREKLSNDFRRKLMIKSMPAFMMYSKELNLSKELL